MNHKIEVLIMVIICLRLETCLGAALQTKTIANSATTTTITHWPPKKSNLIVPTPSNLPAPSPFRKLLTDDLLLYRSYEVAESPLRMNRKLFDHSSSTKAATTQMELHNIDINPYAQSLNAELETAFATVASYASYNNNNINNNVKTLPVATTTNNLNVDQSPTGAASTPFDVDTFDWHRYFSMPDDDDSSLFVGLPSEEQHQQSEQEKQPLEPSAVDVYQAKRSKEIEMSFNKSL